MRKTVLTFGLIAGGLLALMMSATVPFIDRIGFDKGEIIGYTTMVLAFLLVFFGVRSYRENVCGGQISFPRAFLVGILIVAVASICYVIAWEIVYFNFIPDFAEKYANHLIAKLQASGASQQKIDAQLQELKNFKAIYSNPLYNVAFTFLEPLLVGVPVALISALILRKRPRNAVSQPVPQT